MPFDRIFLWEVVETIWGDFPEADGSDVGLSFFQQGDEFDELFFAAVSDKAHMFGWFFTIIVDGESLGLFTVHPVVPIVVGDHLDVIFEGELVQVIRFVVPEFMVAVVKGLDTVDNSSHEHIVGDLEGEHLFNFGCKERAVFSIIDVESPEAFEDIVHHADEHTGFFDAVPVDFYWF